TTTLAGLAVFISTRGSRGIGDLEIPRAVCPTAGRSPLFERSQSVRPIRSEPRRWPDLLSSSRLGARAELVISKFQGQWVPRPDGALSLKEAKAFVRSDLNHDAGRTCCLHLDSGLARNW